jgi:enoyl-[acyl-carrier protein] reductase II
MNPITELLGCKYPVIQGAMGVICNPEMVAAVSEAGGYGLLATAFLTDADVFRRQIEATRKLTDKPFGANLMPMNPITPALAEIAVDMGLPAVTTSGGSPKALAAFFKDHGIKVLHVVANVQGAIKAEYAGVEAIIAEGMESGGMQGLNGVSTLVLVPMVTDAVNIPVVAAGGIGDRRGFRAAMELGASGVQVGTRFIASTECIAHANYKNALINADDTDTILVGQDRIRFRVINTPMVEKLVQQPPEALFAALGSSLEASWIDGDLDAAPIAAGQVAGLVRDVKSIREIIEEMVK